MEHPEIFSPFSKYEEKLGTLQPVYPLTAGLTNNMVTNFLKMAFETKSPLSLHSHPLYKA